MENGFVLECKERQCQYLYLNIIQRSKLFNGQKQVKLNIIEIQYNYLNF